MMPKSQLLKGRLGPTVTMNPDTSRALNALSALQSLAAETPLPLRVRGNCMAPLVKDGAWVAIGGPTDRYWPGDVVAVRTTGRGLALHRVLGAYRRRGEWRYLTQGDRARGPDRAVTADEILGLVGGGDCSPRLIQAPPWHRLRALGRFAAAILIRGITRLRRKDAGFWPLLAAAARPQRPSPSPPPALEAHHD